MDVVAVVGLARSVEEEAPILAKELGLTAYEVGLMLRAPMPVIVLRTDDRARTVEVATRLRGRGHEIVACDAAAVVSSDAMFQPRSFRFEGTDLLGAGGGREERIVLPDLLAFLRATHITRIEETVVEKGRTVSLGRAAMSGGLMLTKKTTTESKRVSDEREPVLYAFRNAGVPILFRATDLRYDGLGVEMKPSQTENFEVFVRTLRALAPTVPFDTRLLAVRTAPSALATAGAKQLASSTVGTIDLLAHIVAAAISRGVRPYR